MPPRYAYWTILIDNKPTAFRAREKEELLPTFYQLGRTNKDVVMKWFARGRLWESREQERDSWQRRKARVAVSPDRRAMKTDWVPRDQEKEKRGRDWRPGGQHKDPRDRFKKRADVERVFRPAHKPSGERLERPRDRRPGHSRDRPSSGAQVFRPTNKPPQEAKKPEPPERK